MTALALATSAAYLLTLSFMSWGSVEITEDKNDNKLRMIKENLSESIQYYAVSDGESI